jgi:hypothetical protein
VDSLAIAGGSAPTASLDLNDNDLIVGSGSYSTLAAQIAHARNGGSWNGTGIASSVAAANAKHSTTLGMLRGDQFIAASGSNNFDGFIVDANNLLVKYTYYGDTDLNGIVNFDDYSRTDAGFNSGGSDWFHGDFDYNGLINFDDYSLIDLAFNTQSGTLRRALSYLDGNDRSVNGMNAPSLQIVMEHFDQFGIDYARGFLNAVPEPTGIALFGVPASAGMLLRRRRRM